MSPFLPVLVAPAMELLAEFREVGERRAWLPATRAVHEAIRRDTEDPALG